MGTEIRCPDQMQTDPDPFVETPGSTTEPSSKPAGNPRVGAQLTKEEEEEAHRQGEQVVRGMKQLGCAMVLLPATIITHRLLTNIWNSWCIVMILVIATKAWLRTSRHSRRPMSCLRRCSREWTCHIKHIVSTPLIVTNLRMS